MGAISDANAGKPDEIARMSGEIRIHRDRGYATMNGVLEGRKIKVKVTYNKSDFTVDRVRRDLNAALSRYQGKGDETEAIQLSSNVWLEFKDKVKTIESEEASSPAKSALHVRDEEKESESKQVQFPKRDKLRLLYGQTKVEEMRRGGTEKTLAEKTLRQSHGFTKIPLETGTLTPASHMKRDVNFLYEQALIELKKEGNQTPKSVEVHNRMTKLNERVDTFTEDELKALLADMRVAMPLQQIDLQKGRNALLLLKAAYGALKESEEPATIDNLRNAMLAMHIPILELSEDEVKSVIKQLEKMIAANPIVFFDLSSPRLCRCPRGKVGSNQDLIRAVYKTNAAPIYPAHTPSRESPELQKGNRLLRRACESHPQPGDSAYGHFLWLGRPHLGIRSC